jgi:hypothetical protein
MAKHTLKSQREIGDLAAEFNLEPLGVTSKGHLKFRHKPTGRIIVTVSSVGGRVLANQRRDIKHCIRRFMGEHHGHPQSN